MKVGFIGLGHMGTGMASSLLRAGHEVTVYNRTKAKAEVLTAQGAKAATTIAEACLGDAVITMLANDAAVESDGLREDGDKGIAFPGFSRINRSNKRKVNFRAGRELVRLREGRRRGRTNQCECQQKRNCNFHENPPACTSVQVIPVTWGSGPRRGTRRWRADLAFAAGKSKAVGEELQPLLV